MDGDVLVECVVGGDGDAGAGVVGVVFAVLGFVADCDVGVECVVGIECEWSF